MKLARIIVGYFLPGFDFRIKTGRIENV